MVDDQHHDGELQREFVAAAMQICASKRPSSHLSTQFGIVLRPLESMAKFDIPSCNRYILAGILILIMGLWMIVENKNKQKAIHKNTFYRGVLSIIIHPQQIPFWIIAGIFIKKVMHNNLDSWNIIGLLLGNAIGTLLIMLAYMVLGNKIFNYFKLNIAYINKVMGIVYIALSLYGFLVS